jgi:hypothetical protein
MRQFIANIHTLAGGLAFALYFTCILIAIGVNIESVILSDPHVSIGEAASMGFICLVVWALTDQ